MGEGTNSSDGEDRLERRSGLTHILSKQKIKEERIWSLVGWSVGSGLAGGGRRELTFTLGVTNSTLLLLLRFILSSICNVDKRSLVFGRVGVFGIRGWIKFFNSVPNGYSMSVGGFSGWG